MAFNWKPIPIERCSGAVELALSKSCNCKLVYKQPNCGRKFELSGWPLWPSTGLMPVTIGSISVKAEFELLVRVGQRGSLGKADSFLGFFRRKPGKCGGQFNGHSSQQGSIESISCLLVECFVGI